MHDSISRVRWEGKTIVSQREISQIELQVVHCRLLAGVLQVVFKVFATFPVSMLIPLNFRGLKKTHNRRPDRWTDPHIEI